MNEIYRRLLVVVPLSALLVACESKKSGNPLSPTVAGPIPGVTITAPKLLEPAPGWQLDNRQQPLTLLLENASSTGQRPLTYVIEIATDAEFKTRVFRREAVTQGENGRTSLRMTDLLQSGRTYYWRAGAEDGANTGPFAPPANFAIITPVIIDTPAPIAPVGGVRLTTNRPEFRVRNPARSGPVGSIAYRFEISTNDSFTALAAVITVTEQASETKFVLGQDLSFDRAHYWRVKAFDPSAESSWSATQVFYTPVEPPPPPIPPPPGPGPAPGPAPPPGSCTSNNGPFIVSCISAKYPQYRVAGISLTQRKANMEFLRDRIIEAGKCGGMDLGWNLKRGGPEKSIDFISQREGGTVHGIDIAHDFDNTGTTLQLQWVEGEFPFYAPYPTPNCN